LLGAVLVLADVDQAVFAGCACGCHKGGGWD